MEWNIRHPGDVNRMDQIEERDIASEVTKLWLTKAEVRDLPAVKVRAMEFQKFLVDEFTDDMVYRCPRLQLRGASLKLY